MKSILITCCSSGIGLDTALSFRDAGWNVIASRRKQKDCKNMQSKHNMHSVLIDYANERSIIKGFTDALVSLAMSVFGSPTYVIDGDMFFGQDLLDLAEYALNKIFQKTISE